MITPDEIPALVQRLNAANIELFECNWPDGALRLRLGGVETGGDEETFVTQPNEADTALKSPGIGILRRCHPLAAVQPLAEGDHIEKGQLVAYLETGAVLLPIHADQSGVMVRWLADEGELIGYGAPLLEFC
jgi:acetyl-CoA carboxylase biotin carboxyl carrier protein